MITIVSGLPRSGTSLMMQMLVAGGMTPLSDGERQADADNPRGYLEFEPVRNLLNDSKWLNEARGSAIKIVAPLLAALPPGLPCRVILCERDMEEVLDSQQSMLMRRNQLPSGATPERRQVLKDEYVRMLGRVKAMLAERPDTQLLVIEHRNVIANPAVAAQQVNRFLDGVCDAAKMAGVVDAALHRNRSAEKPPAARAR